MEIKTLSGTDNKEILKAFNDSFSDYFIPFKLTEEQLASKMLADKTDLGLSVGAFENGKLIAFVLHGFDIITNQKVVYNGGTGVIPEKRGAGLTKQMYFFILPLLKGKGIHRLLLEVIAENVQAIKSYKKSGFKIKRELVCYKGEVSIKNTTKNVVFKNLQSYDWDLMKSFWDVFPTWQNSSHVLDELMTSTVSLGAYFENRLVGYVIYNPTTQRIQQIAIDRDFRKKGMASTLIFELTKKYGNTFSVINVDKRSKGINDFFHKMGFQKNLEQLEMELELDKITAAKV
ncbi:GNAT family N-acetyltransferase [Muricauda sp. SCSIO 64092]|uniref:GNAT family N-acetyltransferase n=1 Tax=Allomuricauda sp. SCSIO 64092 TaxID=2908842 RepID=UPI001FF5A3A7|nr:GNAT family N-acetyltransferase [Muricauda sp. SCSIO 64092]UOY07641.1 GNAT family N-acetyltransferase [Muricauda sp. SCSIO 64092]